MAFKLDPSVDALIKPIISDMTRIDVAQRSNPILGSHNEPEWVKAKKKECVHITWNGSEYELRASKRDGKFICDVCGREICTVFDKSSVDKITDAIPVVNQILFFGLINGLRPEPAATLLSLKRILPDVAQLGSELNEFVKRDSSSADSEKNIGVEYNTPGSFRSITNM